MKRDLAALTACEHDLLIVGGGICGAAAAWDAAQRGLRVALVEARDFGSGTSWNSLKTIHGGLRHLQRLDFAGMRESMRERSAYLRMAPHLVRPLPFLVPTYGHGRRGREALRLALWLSDILGRERNRGLPEESRIPPGRMLSPREVLGRVPGIPAEGLTGGALWYDAQVESSERFLLAFLRAASEGGAALANYVEVVGLLRAGARITGVRARDAERGAEVVIRARLTLNAAGPGLDRVLSTAGLTRPKVPLLRGLNLVLKRPIVAGQAVGASSAGRFLFLVPWRDRAIVGTAYEPVDSIGGDGTVRHFLAAAQRAYPWARLNENDVAVVHQGLVPGTGGGAGLWTRDRLVDHAVGDGVEGLLSAVSVKYTTARALAERAIDRVFERLGRPAPSSLTDVTPLAEAHPLAGTLEARTRRAVKEEMALHLEDALLRRLDLGTAARPFPADVDSVCQVMASELGWDSPRIERERRALTGFRGYNGAKG